MPPPLTLHRATDPFGSRPLGIPGSQRPPTHFLDCAASGSVVMRAKCEIKRADDAAQMGKKDFG